MFLQLISYLKQIQNDEFSLISVGRYNNENNYNDIDLVIIFKSNHDDSELKKILSGLHESKLNALFSYKLFDLEKFQNLYYYDFFRYYEYYISNKIIHGDSINFNLNSKNDYFEDLYNSILIQLVWSVFKITNDKNCYEFITEKFKNRISKNIDIYNTISKKKVSETEFKICFYNKYLKNLTINEKFMNFYFGKYEHEKINKFQFYKDIIKINGYDKVNNFFKNILYHEYI